MKVSWLAATLLVGACLCLAWIATQNEQTALEAEVEKRALLLATNISGSAAEAIVLRDDLTLSRLVQDAGRNAGVVDVRILRKDGTLEASLADPKHAAPADRLTQEGDGALASREGQRLVVAAPVLFSSTLVGEVQVDLDLEQIVSPIVWKTRRELGLATIAVVAGGVTAGVIFVAFLAGPLRRLRAGVERLTAGDLTVRVPPTSRDEVGELTRAFNEMGESLQQKERIQNAFGRYVSESVLRQLLETPEGDELGGAERELTIAFIDIRGFTRISEDMKARDVVALLNEFFQLVSDRILARGGTIDKFIGDSVMVYFGAPLHHPDHAVRAVTAALDIVQACSERNRHVSNAPDRAAAGLLIEPGIGIHTGMVVVGSIGSDRRADYTAVGDAVNVAHRLEKLARPGEILVSEAVQRHVRGACRMRFEGERQLSGRQEPVHVYSLDRGDGSPPPARLEEWERS
jgi:class 3 adenylate cyclase